MLSSIVFHLMKPKVQKRMLEMNTHPMKADFGFMNGMDCPFLLIPYNQKYAQENKYRTYY